MGTDSDKTNKARSISGGWFHLLTLILLILSVVLNVALARRARALKDALLLTKSESGLPIGTVLPPIEAADLDHKPQILTYSSDSLPTIYYVFSPQCGWCAKNSRNLQVLAERTKGRYRLFGLSLSSVALKEFVRDNDIQFPVYTDLAAKSVVAYRLGGTPETLVVSSDGTLLRKWKGAYSGSNKEEIEEYFAITLPGLQEK
jgi:peroxiredoxin